MSAPILLMLVPQLLEKELEKHLLVLQDVRIYYHYNHAVLLLKLPIRVMQLITIPLNY